jgi:ATP-binding cassette subfamily B protein
MPEYNPKSAFKKLFKFVELERKDIGNLYLFALVSGLISLSLPLGIQAMITYLFAGKVSSSVVILTSLILLGILVSGVMMYFNMVITERIQQKTFARYTLSVAETFPNIDLSKIGNTYLPEFANRFFDIPMLQKNLSKILIDFPVASLQIIFGLLLLSIYHPIFIFFNILIVAGVVIFFKLTFDRGYMSSVRESNYKFAIGYWLEDIANNIKSIKLNTNTDYVLNRTDQLVYKYVQARKDHFVVLGYQFGGFVLFKLFTIATLLLVGAFLFLNQEINLGQLVASEIIVITLINSVEKLFSLLETLYDTLTAFDKVHKLLDIEKEKEGSLEINCKDLDALAIELKDVSFKFSESSSYSLKNINLKITEGEKIAIMGAEGSGKSTLMKTLAGAISSSSGLVTVNDIPIDNIKKLNLRSRISELLSDREIFKGTVIDNILVGDKTVKTEVIIAECEKMGLLPYIQNMPNGFEHTLESTGKTLPRGVIIKILLLRAFIDNPALVLLEDYWSILTPNEKQKIENYILSKTNKSTTIVATNDVSFASKFDSVVLMENGHIIAKGKISDISKHEIFVRNYEINR